LRLMEFANVRIRKRGERVEAELAGYTLEEAKRLRAPIVQWAPSDGVEIVVLKPTGPGNVIEERGVGEPALAELREGDVVQFMRFGFVKKIGDRFIYVHE